MTRFRCIRPTCGHPPRGFQFEGDLPVCPKCGAFGAPCVHELVDVHFLVMGQGPLLGGFGHHHVACEPEREHLSLHAADGYAASDMPEAVTCPSCKGTRAYQEMVKALFPKLLREEQIAAYRASKAKVTVDLGDCGCGKK